MHRNIHLLIASFMLVVGATVWFVPWHGPATKIINKPPLKEARIRERITVQDEWFKDADLIVDKTKDAEAHTILQYLNVDSVLGVPGYKAQTFPLEPLDHKPYPFELLVLLKGDEKFGQPWAYYNSSQSVGAAYYQPTHRWLVLPSSNRFSRVFRGFIFLHEGRHAFTYNHHQRMDWRYEPTYCADERDTHEYQNRLMTLYAGQPYINFRHRFVKQLRARLKAVGEKITNGIPGNEGYDRELDKIFGPALSDKERTTRQACVWIDALFSLIDEDYPGNQATKEIYKAQALSTIYHNGTTQ